MPRTQKPATKLERNPEILFLQSMIIFLAMLVFTSQGESNSSFNEIMSDMGTFGNTLPKVFVRGQ